MRDIERRLRRLEVRADYEESGWEPISISIMPNINGGVTVQISEWNNVEMSLAKDIEKHGIGHHLKIQEFNTVAEADVYIESYWSDFEKRTGKIIRDKIHQLRAV